MSEPGADVTCVQPIKGKTDEYKVVKGGTELKGAVGDATGTPPVKGEVKPGEVPVKGEGDDTPKGEGDDTPKGEGADTDKGGGKPANKKRGRKSTGGALSFSELSSSNSVAAATTPTHKTHGGKSRKCKKGGKTRKNKKSTKKSTKKRCAKKSSKK